MAPNKKTYKEGVIFENGRVARESAIAQGAWPALTKDAVLPETMRDPRANKSNPCHSNQREERWEAKPVFRTAPAGADFKGRKPIRPSSDPMCATPKISLKRQRQSHRNKL